jgi:hypothetical protein
MELTDAIAVYLSTVGWKALVIGDVQIRQQPDEASHANYEFVVRFTGGKSQSGAGLRTPQASRSQKRKS